MKTAVVPAVVAIALLAACVEGTGDRPAAEAPRRVRAVVLPYLTMVPFQIAQDRGYFAEQGLEVEFVRLGRNQEIMTALATGEVDAAAGMLTVNELALAATGARIRMIAAMGELAPGHCTFAGFVARREVAESGALEDPERVRRLRFDADILIPFGYWIDEVLRPAALSTGDLDIVNLPSPAALEALAVGSIDVTLDSEPYLSTLTTSGGVLWRGAEDVVPGYVVTMLMYGPTLLDERPEVGERLATALLAGIRHYNLGKTPENVESVARATGLDPERVRQLCWARMSDDARIDPAGFRGYQEWSVAHGLVDRVLEDADLFDARFIEHANAELGR